MKIILHESEEREQICKFAEYLKAKGITKEEFLDVIDKCWSEELQELFDANVSFGDMPLSNWGNGSVKIF